MNKGIMIGVIVAVIVIVAGVSFLSQEGNESDTSVIVTDIGNTETKSKSFQVGLSESIGMAEKP